MIIRVEHPPTGRRIYAHDQRWHHGRTGALLVGAGLTLTALGASPIGIALMGVGASMCWHDRRDFPWPFVDRRPA